MGKKKKSNKAELEYVQLNHPEQKWTNKNRKKLKQSKARTLLENPLFKPLWSPVVLYYLIGVICQYVT